MFGGSRKVVGVENNLVVLEVIDCVKKESSQLATAPSFYNLGNPPVTHNSFAREADTVLNMPYDL